MDCERSVSLRLAEQELFISHAVLIPTSEVDWLEAIDHTALVSEDVDRMGPKLGDELNNALGTAHNTPMGTIIDGQLERLWLFEESGNIALLL